MGRQVKLESKIQAEIRQYLEDRGWTVLRMHGNLYQKGIPDLYACRNMLQRWIEVKRPTGYRLTAAQKKVFPSIEAQGIGIWIMTSVYDYPKLFQPPNWRVYLPKGRG